MRQFVLACAVVLAALLFLPSSLMAAQSLPAGCEKETGDILCEDPVGESEASGGQSQSVDTSTKGSLHNTNKLECSGPGNSSSGC